MLRSHCHFFNNKQLCFLLLCEQIFVKCYIKVAPQFRLEILESYYPFKLVKTLLLLCLPHTFSQRFMNYSTRRDIFGNILAFLLLNYGCLRNYTSATIYCYIQLTYLKAQCC